MTDDIKNVFGCLLAACLSVLCVDCSGPSPNFVFVVTHFLDSVTLDQASFLFPGPVSLHFWLPLF